MKLKAFIGLVMLGIAGLSLLFGYGQYYGGVCFLICELLITEVFWELLMYMINKKAKLHRVRNFAICTSAILSSMYIATLIATFEILFMTSEPDFAFMGMVLAAIAIITVPELILLVSIVSKTVFTYKQRS